MIITMQELKKMPETRYQIIDMRDAVEIAHGAIPGAVALKPEQIQDSQEVDREKTLVIVCSHGKKSVETAEDLCDAGLDAVSLQGGYTAWLLDTMDEPEAEITAADVEQSLRKRFKKTIWSKFAKAVNTYELIKPGDHIAVCISGGKDSMLMAKCFQEIKRHNKFEFEVEYLVMDPGYSPENRKVIENNAKKLNVPIKIFESDIFESVYHVDKSPCYLCARMSRGHLYNYAKELGCNKIALGHHYDDVIETILMGMLYGAQVQTMMPKLHSTNFEGMELTDTCTTCNNEENASKRLEIKELIKTLKETNPYVEGNIFKSVENVNLNTVVAYKKDGVKHSFLEHYDKD